MTANDARHVEEELVSVRGASPTDAPDVCRLLAALGYPAEVAVVRDRIASFDTSNRDYVLLAELDEQVVGVLALSLTPRFAEHGLFSRITALAVDPTVQRGGVGRRLVTEAERIAADNASTLMQVNSGRRPERAAAHAFYLSLGYADQHDHHILYEKALGARAEPLRTRRARQQVGASSWRSRAGPAPEPFHRPSVRNARTRQASE